MTAIRRTTQPKLRTPEEARQHLRDMGITVVAFARQNNLDRHAVNDALRGVGKGNFGKSHEAAIALGIKRDPNSCTVPANSRQSPTLRGKSGKATTKNAVAKRASKARGKA
ncbi:DNA-binding protein [Stenotrophomonas maltophilia]|uniref:DNA-binding protein n=1 Tax=Stenotrophomonas maltophilia TaxID=40324 RepID=UPI002E77EB91|nr:DNA-binding protein [Stenotrophomonas maltophilia]